MQVSISLAKHASFTIQLHYHQCILIVLIRLACRKLKDELNKTKSPAFFGPDSEVSTNCFIFNLQIN